MGYEFLKRSLIPGGCGWNTALHPSREGISLILKSVWLGIGMW